MKNVFLISFLLFFALQAMAQNTSLRDQVTVAADKIEPKVIVEF